jgi:hypothetical protein
VKNEQQSSVPKTNELPQLPNEVWLMVMENIVPSRLLLLRHASKWMSERVADCFHYSHTTYLDHKDYMHDFVPHPNESTVSRLEFRLRPSLLQVRDMSHYLKAIVMQIPAATLRIKEVGSPPAGPAGEKSKGCDAVMITREIVAELRKYPHLERLHLDRVSLARSAVADLKQSFAQNQFSNLVDLELRNYADAADFPQLASTDSTSVHSLDTLIASVSPSVTSIRFVNNGLLSNKMLSALISRGMLEHLSLRRCVPMNRIDLGETAPGANLKSLDLSWMSLTDIQGVDSLGAHVTLNLRGNQLTAAAVAALQGATCKIVM